MFYLYILLCADGKLYTGITNNVRKRIQNHELGVGSKYVKDRLPIKLIYTEQFKDKCNAAKREKQIKGWRRQKKIDILKLEL